MLGEFNADISMAPGTDLSSYVQASQKQDEGGILDSLSRLVDITGKAAAVDIALKKARTGTPAQVTAPATIVQTPVGGMTAGNIALIIGAVALLGVGGYLLLAKR